MYQLHFKAGTCALATQTILRELNQSVQLIDKNGNKDFMSLNPVGVVPVLVDGQQVLCEGAAIILHLLNKHENSLLPQASVARQSAIENILFANATMHPAYGRLFFMGQHLPDGEAKDVGFNAAADEISRLWAVVEQKLSDKPFLGGDTVSAADIMLTVYSRWGQYFPVEITIGQKTQRMLEAVTGLDSFQASLEAEASNSVAA